MQRSDAYAFIGYEQARAYEQDRRLLEQAMETARRKGDGWKLKLLELLK